MRGVRRAGAERGRGGAGPLSAAHGGAGPAGGSGRALPAGGRADADPDPDGDTCGAMAREGAGLFAAFRVLGRFSGHVPHVLRYHGRHREFYLAVAIGRSVHTYNVSARRPGPRSFLPASFPLPATVGRPGPCRDIRLFLASSSALAIVMRERVRGCCAPVLLLCSWPDREGGREGGKEGGCWLNRPGMSSFSHVGSASRCGTTRSSGAPSDGSLSFMAR